LGIDIFVMAITSRLPGRALTFAGEEINGEAQRGSTAMSGIDVLGYLAALAVLAAFCMSSIVPLRITAIMSNVLFALYGLSAHLYPVFLLHSILLPINVFKLTHVELLPRNGRGMVGNRFWSRPPIQKQSR
jgi:hypothetical protein